MTDDKQSSLRTWPLLVGGLLLGWIQQTFIFLPLMVLANSDGRLYFFQLFLKNQLPSPLAYRPLSYLLESAALRMTGNNLGDADLFINAVCTAIALLLGVRFAERFTSTKSAVIAVLWMYLLLPIGFAEHLHQPSDFPNLAFTCALYLVSLAPTLIPLVLLSVVSTLNRESFVLFMLYPLILHLRQGTLAERIKPLFVGLGCCLITGALVYVAVGHRKPYEKFVMLHDNLTRPYWSIWIPNLVAGIVPQIGVAWWGWKRLPEALRWGVLFSGIYLALMLVIGRMPEFRLFFPLLPLLCTAAVAALEVPRAAEASVSGPVEESQ